MPGFSEPIYPDTENSLIKIQGLRLMNYDNEMEIVKNRFIPILFSFS